ncbi:MAG: hypothetical protein ACXADB_07885 [Candidatus Hermodarchaeia archaeon]|jgi:hypothetical protein
MRMISKRISPGALEDAYDEMEKDHNVFWNIRFWVDQVVHRSTRDIVLALVAQTLWEGDWGW